MKIPNFIELDEICRKGIVPPEFREWAEVAKGHFCAEWDDMYIHKGQAEYDACLCFGDKKHTD